MAKAKEIKPLSNTKIIKVLLADPRDANDIFSDLTENGRQEDFIYKLGFNPDNPGEMLDMVDNYTSFQEFEVRVTTEIIPRKKFTFKITTSLEPED